MDKTNTTRTEIYEPADSNARFIATVAFIIALIALALGIAAYNRAGRDIEDQVRDVISDITTDDDDNNTTNVDDAVVTQLESSRRQVAQSIRTLRDRINSGATFNEVQNDWNAIKGNLQNAYSTAGAEFNDDADELNEDLEEIENDLKDDTKNALDPLDDFISRLEEAIEN